MTYQLTVVYHQPTDPEAFDRHYAETHAPLASKIPGVRSYTSTTPDAGPDGQRPEHLVAMVVFDDKASFEAGMGSDEGKAAVADVDNFATGGATMMTGEVTSFV